MEAGCTSCPKFPRFIYEFAQLSKVGETRYNLIPDEYKWWFKSTDSTVGGAAVEKMQLDRICFSSRHGPCLHQKSSSHRKVEMVHDDIPPLCSIFRATHHHGGRSATTAALEAAYWPLYFDYRTKVLEFF